MASKTSPDGAPSAPKDTPKPRKIGYISDALPKRTDDEAQPEMDTTVTYTDWASI